MTDPFVALHHIQLAIPAGGEEAGRHFWGGLLGLTEVPKPPRLAVRGGCWFRSDSGGFEVHLGVEEPFAAALKAHPGLVVCDVDAVADTLAAAGVEVRWSDEIPGTRRFHADDPFGNRIEFIGADRV